jgi:hypothetical protein
MNYLHTSKGRGIASSERLASGGNHISTDGGSHLCTHNSPAAAIISACTPLRKGPRPRLPAGGDNEAIKAKELEVQRQEALTVSPAEATTSAMGSLTSGSDHISPTSGSDHLCTDGRRLPQHARRGPRSRPYCGSEDKTIQERRRRPRGVRRLVQPPPPPGRPAAQEKPWMWPTRAWRDRRPCDGRAAMLRPSSKRQRRRRHQSHPGRGARHATADGAPDGRPHVPGVRLLRKVGERPSPPNARGRSRPPAHVEGEAPTRLALLPSADDEHP